MTDFSLHKNVPGEFIVFIIQGQDWVKQRIKGDAGIKFARCFFPVNGSASIVL